MLDHGVPHATLLWGRRVVDESVAAYLSSYLGASSDDVVRTAVEDSDVVVLAGVQFTDLASGFFSQRIEVAGSVEIRGEYATVGGVRFSPIVVIDALSVVADAVARARGHLQLVEPGVVSSGAAESDASTVAGAPAAAPMPGPLDSGPVSAEDGPDEVSGDASLD